MLRSGLRLSAAPAATRALCVSVAPPRCEEVVGQVQGGAVARRKEGRGEKVRPFEEIPHTGSNGWVNLLHFWRTGKFSSLHKHMEETFNTLGPIYR